jgi:tRNA(fMet)-specific endonuclease VapC
MTYLLDTNVFIHANKNLGQVKDRLRHHSPSDVNTSVVTVADLLYGSMKMPNPEDCRNRWLTILKPFCVVDFCVACAEHHATLRYQMRHNPIGERDLLIAAIATTHNLIVVTHNSVDFSRVPGLRCEDWY